MELTEKNARAKLEKLNDILLGIKKAVVAFSGGADSAFLSAAAFRALGENAVAVTAFSALMPAREREEAEKTAGFIGIKHFFVETGEMDVPEFVANSPDRCYHCKKRRYEELKKWARERGFFWLIEGSNADDIHDYRPGLKAVEEMECVRAPLIEAGITKEEIRFLSRQWGLPSWDRPSSACLASRISYGLPITLERLSQVDRAEEVVRKYVRGQVRVRHHGAIARVEVPREDIPAAAEKSEEIAARLKEIGFSFVTLDLEGYRSGSMNRQIGL